MKNADDKNNVTKHDLESTKNELLDRLISKKEFRSEIDKLVTKEEFRSEIDKLATKKELQSEITRLDGSIEILANQVAKNTDGIKDLHVELAGLRREMNDRFSDMGNKFDIVLTAIDGLASQIRDMRAEKAAGEHTFLRHETRLDDHETRIRKLEERAG